MTLNETMYLSQGWRKEFPDTGAKVWGMSPLPPKKSQFEGPQLRLHSFQRQIIAAADKPQYFSYFKVYRCWKFCSFAGLNQEKVGANWQFVSEIRQENSYFKQLKIKNRIFND